MASLRKLRELLDHCHELLAEMEARADGDTELEELLRATCRHIEQRVDARESD